MIKARAKKGLGRGLSALFGDLKEGEKSRDLIIHDWP